MAGSIELYRECMKAGIKPFPGSEFYLMQSRDEAKAAKNRGPAAKRYHCCMVAYTTQGYRNLVRISTDSHRNFYNKPNIDFADLARYHEMGWSEGIALTTGCFFGLVIQTLVNTGYDEAKQIVSYFASLFDTYVEIQNHCIEREEGLAEDEIATSLVRIADDLGLPVIITQDSHYVAPAEQSLHNSFKRLVSYGDGTDDVEFPGDGYHLVDDDWMRRHHGADIYARGTAGLDLLLSRHDLRIPEADHYSYKVPALSADPDADIRRRCFKALHDRHLLTQSYLARMEEELEVISAARMGDYMLLVTRVCDYMRANHIVYQSRGSAAGSLVCWLLGITSIDPIVWGARFDRFLTKDRMKPPDIDLDVDTFERARVMAWVGTMFHVQRIGTWGLLGMDKNADGKGSLKVKYFSKRRKVMQAKGQEPEPDDWSSIPQSDKNELYTLADKKTFSNAGTHPCAIALLNTEEELNDMLPLQMVGGSLVTQFDGDVVESLGIIKLDLLGLDTMAILKLCCENMGVTPDYLETIPFTAKDVYEAIGHGDVTGAFQLEGYAMMLGCKGMRPRNISEIVDAVALFRPAAMKSGATDSYIARKFGREEIPKRHQIIEANVAKTRGILLYQDQIISIVRSLGFGADDVTRVLKAVKASNAKVAEAKKELDYYMPLIKARCQERGMTDEDWAWMENAFAAFAEYSFNVPHATVYGITAYRSAYLTIHQPVAYHAAMLAVAVGSDKEERYLKAVRRRRIKIDRPNLNESGLSYKMSADGKRILKGFQAIEGIGPATARDLVAGQPYSSWTDFADKAIGTEISGVRTFHPDQTSAEQLIGTVKALYTAGVFDKEVAPPLGEGYVKKTRKKKILEEAA
jgi:DNA polymerase-3 subunit alpha